MFSEAGKKKPQRDRRKGFREGDLGALKPDRLRVQEDVSYLR